MIAFAGYILLEILLHYQIRIEIWLVVSDDINGTSSRYTRGEGKSKLARNQVCVFNY